VNLDFQKHLPRNSSENPNAPCNLKKVVKELEDLTMIGEAFNFKENQRKAKVHALVGKQLPPNYVQEILKEKPSTQMPTEEDARSLKKTAQSHTSLKTAATSRRAS